MPWFSCIVRPNRAVSVRSGSPCGAALKQAPEFTGYEGRGDRIRSRLAAASAVRGNISLHAALRTPRSLRSQRGAAMVEYVLLANFLVLGLLIAVSSAAQGVGQTYVDAGSAMVGGQQLTFSMEGGGTVQTSKGPSVPQP